MSPYDLVVLRRFLDGESIGDIAHHMRLSERGVEDCLRAALRYRERKYLERLMDVRKPEPAGPATPPLRSPA